MPFKSEAQRRKFHAMARRDEISDDTVDAWEAKTRKDIKLPKKIKHSQLLGAADALEHLGFKQASEELRLKIPSRTFHGLDAAHRTDSKRAGNDTSPDAPPDEGTSDALEAQLEQLETPVPPGDQVAARDPLDRQTAWGAPSNLAAGDTANRLSDMGQSTSFGGI
jgi:hypothetical protein